MKKLISRVCCLCCVVLVLAACLPFSAFAVDPVSAGVMANAFAQAIAAYGASNGVAMTFDVTSTSGIGESVHELWKDFREGTQDADDYATLAAALFPDLYYKASSVVAGASDVYTVGYNISSTYAEEFDNFFNWLLSGPAEMVKVDNAYYQFSSAQIGSSASSIVVYGSDSAVSIIKVSSLVNSYASVTSGTLLAIEDLGARYNSWYSSCVSVSTDPVYCYGYINSNNVAFYFFSESPFDFSTANTRSTSSTNTYNYNTHSAILDNDTGLYMFSGLSLAPIPTGNDRSAVIPIIYPSLSDAKAASVDFLSGNVDSVGVKAATNTGVAEFPDTTDPNYEAVGKQIPSTVPWDNTAYGDGTGTLTDAQAGAIAAGADTAIARDGVLDLAGTDEATDEPGVDDPPSTDPDDYAVPGLAEIFPFCIPFDIYNFLSALAANPVAPHFTATLDFPEAVGGTQTIDIDFDSPTWNQLAQLLRLLELLAFIIGLALLTRSMFIRG